MLTFGNSSPVFIAWVTRLDFCVWFITSIKVFRIDNRFTQLKIFYIKIIKDRQNNRHTRAPQEAGKLKETFFKICLKEAKKRKKKILKVTHYINNTRTNLAVVRVRTCDKNHNRYDKNTRTSIRSSGVGVALLYNLRYVTMWWGWVCVFVQRYCVGGELFTPPAHTHTFAQLCLQRLVEIAAMWLWSFNTDIMKNIHIKLLHNTTCCFTQLYSSNLICMLLVLTICANRRTKWTFSFTFLLSFRFSSLQIFFHCFTIFFSRFVCPYCFCLSLAFTVKTLNVLNLLPKGGPAYDILL